MTRPPDEGCRSELWLAALVDGLEAEALPRGRLGSISCYSSPMDGFSMRHSYCHRRINGPASARLVIAAGVPGKG